MLTDEEKQKLSTYLGSVLSEHFDGFILVGTRAGTGEALMVFPPMMDQKTKICLSTMAVGAGQAVHMVAEPE